MLLMNNYKSWDFLNLKTIVKIIIHEAFNVSLKVIKNLVTLQYIVDM